MQIIPSGEYRIEGFFTSKGQTTLFFEGYLKVVRGGHLRGVLIDTYGPANIRGRVTRNPDGTIGMLLSKRYDLRDLSFGNILKKPVRSILTRRASGGWSGQWETTHQGETFQGGVVLTILPWLDFQAGEILRNYLVKHAYLRS